jgi:hypothetical protein
MKFKLWLLKQENFGPAHTGGMSPPKQVPVTPADLRKDPDNALGVSGIRGNPNPTGNINPTAKSDDKESNGEDCYACRHMKKKMKKKLKA